MPKIFCESCKNWTIQHHAENREYTYMGLKLDIKDDFFKCSNCGEEYSADGFDLLAAIYTEYNKMVNS